MVVPIGNNTSRETFGYRQLGLHVRGCSLVPQRQNSRIQLKVSELHWLNRILHINTYIRISSFEKYLFKLRISGWRSYLSFLLRIPLYRILLVNTKVVRNTKMLVSSLKGRVERQRKICCAVLDAIDEISTQCWSNLKNTSLTNDQQYQAASVSANGQHSIHHRQCRFAVRAEIASHYRS